MYCLFAAHESFQYTNVGDKFACEVNATTPDRSVRLIGTSMPHIGRLEIFYNNEWGSICFDNFSAPEGHVACKEMGYSGINYYVHVG